MWCVCKGLHLRLGAFRKLYCIDIYYKEYHMWLWGSNSSHVPSNDIISSRAPHCMGSQMGCMCREFGSADRAMNNFTPGLPHRMEIHKCVVTPVGSATTGSGAWLHWRLDVTGVDQLDWTLHQHYSIASNSKPLCQGGGNNDSPKSDGCSIDTQCYLQDVCYADFHTLYNCLFVFQWT